MGGDSAKVGEDSVSLAAQRSIIDIGIPPDFISSARGALAPSSAYVHHHHRCQHYQQCTRPTDYVHGETICIDLVVHCNNCVYSER